MNLAGWAALIKERFPPASYGPMIFLFCIANLSFQNQISELHTWRIIAALILGFSYFLRLRLFDEIKDLETDIAVNPKRPLARGIISVDEVKLGILFLIVIEATLFLTLARESWPFWILPLTYSLLMYNEFFLSKWIRPHLTTYAVTHTFVSVFMGLSLWNFATKNSSFGAIDQILFFLANWAIFNLFEFARKTFAPKEERKSVESYSKLFGLWGASLLSYSQLLLFFMLINRSWQKTWTFEFQSTFGRIVLASLSLYFMVCLAFCIRKTISSAKVFRAFSGLLLLISYGLIIYLTIYGAQT